MGTKILILGSHGTLGQALTLELGHHGYQLTTWDRTDLDITSNQITPKITELKPDVIINATGYNAVDKAESSEEEKAAAFLLNTEVPEKLANLAKSLDAIFVNFSTDYVFKGDKKHGYVESDMPDPQSNYAKSKYEGEKEVQKTNGKYYIIRLSRLFGEKGVSISSKRSFVEIMLGEIDKPELMVKNEDYSSPTYAPDLSVLVRNLIESKKPWGIYHGANSGACTWYEWAGEIFRLMGRGPKLIPGTAKDYPNTAPHPAYSELINTKLPQGRSWREALAEFLKS